MRFHFKVSFIWRILPILSFIFISKTPFSISSPPPPPPDFIQIRDSHFEFNGSSFLFNGFNSYWMMSVGVEPNERHKISEVFREAASTGLTVCRTWAFSDGGYNALQISPGVYDEKVFQALDFVISEARNYGIRLILSLINNYNDYGGRPQYVQWARNAGFSIPNDDGFYTNQVVKSYYKNYVKKLLTRKNTLSGSTYKDDPTIMAWELMNEPRCDSDYSGTIINGWVQEMASFVKSVDKKHLVGIGMEGFYGNLTMKRVKKFNPNGYQVGTDFISTHLIKEIDFATIHAYPDVWLSKENETTQMEFLHKWTAIHWRDSKRILKKPLVFGEFGKSSKVEPGFNMRDRDSFLNTVYKHIFNLARNEGIMGGGLVWQLMAKEMDSYHDGYEIILSQNPSTKSILAQQSNKMLSLQHQLTFSNTVE